MQPRAGVAQYRSRIRLQQTPYRRHDRCFWSRRRRQQACPSFRSQRAGNAHQEALPETGSRGLFRRLSRLPTW